MDIKFYLSLFLRRAHWFLLFFIIGSAAGVTLSRILPPVYQAEARLLVENEQIPGNLAASTVQTGATEQLQIIQQRILTRDTLIELANRLNVYGPPGSQERAQMTAEQIVTDLRERIIISSNGGGAARRGPTQAVIVGVSFQSDNPQLAATVTNEVVTLILREDVALRTTVARQTLDFFEQEVRRLDQELAERGRLILEFKEANQEALPDSLDFRRNQLASTEQRLIALEQEEVLLRDQRQRMVRLHESLAATQGNTPDRPLTDEERQLRAKQEERTAQLTVLSPEHPRIKALDTQIVALEARVAAQRASLPPEQQSGPSAYQLQLAEMDSKLEFIALQSEQLRDAAAQLRVTIEATPKNDIALSALERDYANINAQYNQAVAAKARAETGDLIEARNRGQRISVVEQAVVPNEPASPNRLLIAGGGVGGGFALGLAFIVLLELLNAGVRRPVEITNKLGITPLATLPYMRTRREIWLRRTIILSVLSALLIGIPLALWALHTYYLPLDLLIENMLGRFGLAGGDLPPVLPPVATV